MADNNFLGLYLDLKARRQQDEQLRAQQEASAESQRLDALMKSGELAFKSGDYELGAAIYDATTPLGRASDYKLLKSYAKAGKAKLSTPTAKGQSELASGFATQDPLQQALTGFRMEEQGVPEGAVQQMQMRGQALAQEQARRESQFQGREAFKAGMGLEAYGAKQSRKAEDTIYSVRDQSTGKKDSIVGLQELRAARAENPNLIVTGKPTSIGTEEEVFGKPTKTRIAQLEDDVMHLDQAASDMDEAISFLEQSKGLGGGLGTLLRAAGGGYQTIQEMAGIPLGDTISELADATMERITADVDAGRMDAKASRSLINAITDPEAAALDVLGASITYGYARALRGEGKLTVDDKERAENAVGIRTGLLTSQEQVLSRLRFARKRIGRQQITSKKRLEFKRPQEEPFAPGEATMTPLGEEPAGGFDIDLMESP